MPDLRELTWNRTWVAGVQTGLERLKKNCSHAEREFLSFGEALAKEQLNPEPCDCLPCRSFSEGRSRNEAKTQKDRPRFPTTAWLQFF